MVIRKDDRRGTWWILVDAGTSDHHLVSFYRVGKEKKRVIHYSRRRRRWEFVSAKEAAAFFSLYAHDIIIDWAEEQALLNEMQEDSHV